MRSTTARGYGNTHQKTRRYWAARLRDAGAMPCARGCGTILTPDQPWDLGHTDDRTGYTGPECVPCNRGAGGRNGAAAVNGRTRQATIRDW